MKLSVSVTQVSKQNLEWNKKYMEYLNLKKDAKTENVKSKTNVDVNNRYGRVHKLTHIVNKSSINSSFQLKKILEILVLTF